MHPRCQYVYVTIRHYVTWGHISIFSSPTQRTISSQLIPLPHPFSFILHHFSLHILIIHFCVYFFPESKDKCLLYIRARFERIQNIATRYRINRIRKRNFKNVSISIDFLIHLCYNSYMLNQYIRAFAKERYHGTDHLPGLHEADC